MYPNETNAAAGGIRVLVVEDDPVLADGISGVLRTSGRSVHCIADGVHAYDALVSESYDLVVLDLGLPRMDGAALLQRVRDLGNDIPVLVVTARHAVADRVGGLKAGADDYLTKPFDLEEFEARVASLLRRTRKMPGQHSAAGKTTLDPVSRGLRVEGDLVNLTEREFSILEILLANEGTLVSREQMNKHVALDREELTDNLFHVHISRLRKKIAGSNYRIRVVRGFGYMLQRFDTGR